MVRLNVVVTDVYDPDAEYIIHAVVVLHGGVRQQATTESICHATSSALAKGDELACHSIVFPALGCGNGGFYIRDGGELICREIWITNRMSLRRYDLLDIQIAVQSTRTGRS